MKRFHVHVGVDNLDASIAFYSGLFGQGPSVVKSDYAKWMLDDPRVNFAISTRGAAPGIDHLGIQTDDPAELAEMKARAEAAALATEAERESTTNRLVTQFTSLVESETNLGRSGEWIRQIAEIRRRVGVVFQDPDDQLFMPTVRDDVAFGPLNQGLPTAAARSRADTALAAVDAGHLAARAPYRLSGGEKRVVAIAGVLAMVPASPTPMVPSVFVVDGEVVVPIRAAVQVFEPKLFAVTVERPGGVVVSKRERIVLTAAL